MGTHMLFLHTPAAVALSVIHTKAGALQPTTSRHMVYATYTCATLQRLAKSHQHSNMLAKHNNLPTFPTLQAQMAYQDGLQ